MTLDDLFTEMLRNLDELIESALVEEHDPNYLTSEQLTSREREYVWECLARALLLCQSADGFHAKLKYGYGPGAVTLPPMVKGEK